MENEVVSKNFIEQFIDKDLAEGVYDTVHTRFPPEPNGYLHIGHAKSILLNYGLAQKYNGKFNLRFDDTNPTKEKIEFVESIKADVEWLGADFEDRLFYASNYFQEMYESEPVVEAIHAGLECGLFTKKIDGLDSISIGPNMQNVHTSEETLEVGSVQRTWEFLCRVLSQK